MIARTGGISLEASCAFPAGGHAARSGRLNKTVGKIGPPAPFVEGRQRVGAELFLRPGKQACYGYGAMAKM